MSTYCGITIVFQTRENKEGNIKIYFTIFISKLKTVTTKSGKTLPKETHLNSIFLPY